ncbi:hypothetical protein RKD30_006241 [Streptomyces pristinaespiralis]
MRGRGVAAAGCAAGRRRSPRGRVGGGALPLRGAVSPPRPFPEPGQAPDPFCGPPSRTPAPRTPARLGVRPPACRSAFDGEAGMRPRGRGWETSAPARRNAPVGGGREMPPTAAGGASVGEARELCRRRRAVPARAVRKTPGAAWVVSAGEAGRCLRRRAGKRTRGRSRVMPRDAGSPCRGAEVAGARMPRRASGPSAFEGSARSAGGAGRGAHGRRPEGEGRGRACSSRPHPVRGCELLLFDCVCAISAVYG